MNRHFLNDDSIDKEFLLGDSWDLLEFNIEINVRELTNWYRTVSDSFKYLRFDFSQTYLLSNQFANATGNTYGLENALQGKIYSWSLDWPVEKEIPIPPIFAANPEKFPELEQKIEFKLQQKFKFGYFKKMCDILGENTFQFSRITEHDTDAKIFKHVDYGLGLRLHIPIIANNESTFLFGDNLDRCYTFDPGKIYLINAKIPHSTENRGLPRVHIISDPGIDKILDLSKMRVSI